MRRYDAIIFLLAILVGGAWHNVRAEREQHAQTAALERIADELKPPLHSETTITKVDEGVCDTLGNALMAVAKKGKK